MERHPRKCHGTSQTTGQPCERWAIKGGTVCPKHGGAAPQVKAKAAENVQREQAERAVIRFGLKRDIGPHDALLEQVQTSARLVGEYEAILAQIDRDRLVHGIIKTVQLPPSKENPMGGRRVEAAAARNVWLGLYNDERDRLVKACATAIGCGIAERQVQIAEGQAQQLAKVITAILADLGHDLTEPRVREVVRLRLIEGGKAA